VTLAGVFALQVRDFSYTYRSPIHALHLHDYDGTARLNGVDYPLKPGTITFSPAGEPSSYHLPRPGTHWCIHFRPIEGPSQGPALQMPMARSLGEHAIDAAKRFAEVARLHALQQANDADAAVTAGVSIAMAALLAWVGLLDKVTDGQHAPRHATVNELIDHIDRNLHRPLSAAGLAERAGLSQNYLARLFRQRTGLTIPRHVLVRRIAVARVLLETTDLAIKQVALRVGMPDAQHFNKQFRAVAGVSPSAYRQAIGGGGNGTG
jgi:AraC-like DNA-binding protein